MASIDIGGVAAGDEVVDEPGLHLLVLAGAVQDPLVHGGLAILVCVAFHNGPI